MPVHHIKVLNAFLDKYKNKLELIFLQPYSKNLNLVDRFLDFIQKQITHNPFFKTFKAIIKS